MATKYPKTIIDEVSGTEVPSELYKAYQDRIREVVEFVKNNLIGGTEHYLALDGRKWQAKLKEWGDE